MIEFVVLAALALGVAVYVAFPRRGDTTAVLEPDIEGLRERRGTLLRQLRELDEDLAAGRISGDDRRAGRRALGPSLREVTEALRAHDGAGTRS